MSFYKNSKPDSFSNYNQRLERTCKTKSSTDSLNSYNEKNHQNDNELKQNSRWNLSERSSSRDYRNHDNDSQRHNKRDRFDRRQHDRQPDRRHNNRNYIVKHDNEVSAPVTFVHDEEAFPDLNPATVAAQTQDISGSCHNNNMNFKETTLHKLYETTYIRPSFELEKGWVKVQKGIFGKSEITQSDESELYSYEREFKRYNKKYIHAVDNMLNAWSTYMENHYHVYEEPSLLETTLTNTQMILDEEAYYDEDSSDDESIDDETNEYYDSDYTH
jgi:hypothetical protein